MTRHHLLRVLSLAAALGLWQLLTAFDVELWLRFEQFPTIGDVTREFGQRVGSDAYWQDLADSLSRILTGFALAAVAGTAIARSRLAADVLGPVLEVLRPIPAIALVPVAILLFPSNEQGIVFITFTAAFFPVMVSTRHAVRALTPVWEETVLTMGGGRWRALGSVVLPGALPGILGGLSVGIGVSWICVISAEMISGEYGVGYRTWQDYTVVDYPGVFVGMVTIGALGWMTSTALEVLGRAHELIYRPLRNPDGPPQPQVEYKLRRFVNDYVAPPKSGARLSLAVDHFERMRGEIDDMGAQTSHELMRCAEVHFIRDCAEMAARSSLARTESRWGLYHERTDHPKRDDDGWLHHLDLRNSPSGTMEFTARPVEPYLIPVEEFTPVGGASRHLGEVHPEQVATAGQRDLAPVGSGIRTSAAESRDTTTTASHSPRILELLTLTEEAPELLLLRPFLTDPDPAVRRAAVAALTETVPPGTGLALADTLADPDSAVRGAAAASLRELVEVLPPEPELGSGLHAALAHGDALVRSTALDVLRALRLGDATAYAPALTDPDIEVRIASVRALVSVSALDAVARAGADPAREVRVTVARGLDTPRALAPLLHDADILVRAAAFTTLASVGCPAPYDLAAVEALAAPSWQVRTGAATALGAADPHRAVPALSRALGDPNADVRKAAVLALLQHPANEDARTALATAVLDPDADVRAYAARAAAPA